MNPDNRRSNALKMLRENTIALLKARESNGGMGSGLPTTAASIPINQANNVTTTAVKVTSSNTQKFGLKDRDIRDFAKVSKPIDRFATSNASGGNTAEQKASCNKVNSFAASPFNTKLEVMSKSADEKKKVVIENPSSNLYRSPINESKRPQYSTNGFASSSRADDKSPPRKIMAQSKPLQNDPEQIIEVNDRFQSRPPISKRSIDVPPSSRKFIWKPPTRQEERNDRKSEVPAQATIKAPEEPPKNMYPDFKSAKRELQIQNVAKYGNPNGNQPPSSNGNPPAINKEQPGYHPVKTLGMNKNSANKQYKKPISNPEPKSADEGDPDLLDPLLQGIDPVILETIKREIIDCTKEVTWDDIAGLEDAKETIHEAVVLPLLRPELFQGLRSIPKGILLFGPPGTGKTLIGKCIASQAEATFFSISASSLTSKWIGEGEKLVRALFLYARFRQPSVIFLDEIDSVLSKRSETEHESSRRLKTEFLIQLEGAHTTKDNDLVLLVGATNRPQELDDAARRRFTKRLYIPLPEYEARYGLLKNLLTKNTNSLTEKDLSEVAESCDGYSGADIKNLCADAAMFCFRELSKTQIMNLDPENLRPINIEDFRKSLKRVKATVSQHDLQQYKDWDRQYGSTA